MGKTEKHQVGRAAEIALGHGTAVMRHKGEGTSDGCDALL
jgi:hypothetical protein